MPTETGPNFKTHALCWPRNELVLAWPQVNKLAIQDDLNGAWTELWRDRPTLHYRTMSGFPVILDRSHTVAFIALLVQSNVDEVSCRNVGRSPTYRSEV